MAAPPAAAAAGATAGQGGDLGYSAPALPASAPTFSVEENEKRLLREALLKARGNRSEAAKLMGVSRRTLHRKLAQWPELDVIDK